MWGRENKCCHGESISATCWRYENRLNIVRKNRKRNGQGQGQRKVKDYKWLSESEQPTCSWINWVISLIKGEKKQLKDIIKIDYATKCPVQ